MHENENNEIKTEKLNVQREKSKKNHKSKKLKKDNTDVKRFLDTDEVYKGNADNKIELYFNDIEYDTLHIDTNSMLSGKKCLFVTAQIQGTQPYAVPIPPADAQWLRVSGDFLTIAKVWDVWKMPQFTLQFKYDNHIVKSKFVRVHRILNQGEKKQKMQGHSATQFRQ